METTIIFPAHHDAVDEKNNTSIRPFSIYNSATERAAGLILIVAMARDNAIGKGGEIPWHLPEDLAHFKKCTMGHPIIMGRKTWDSLPFKPLKGRRNIVISRNSALHIEGADCFDSLEAAVESCISEDTPFVIGGEQIYKIAMPHATELIITEVDTSCPDADAFFPKIDPKIWELIEQSDEIQSKSGLKYRIKRYIRQ